jgi:hypothetical protein
LVLLTDRLDLDSAKDRARFAAARNGQAELVEDELLVIAQLLADDNSRPENQPAVLPAIPYRATPTGLVVLRSSRYGEVEVPLCNFTAKIVAQVAEDDGVEVRRLFEIEAELGNRVARFPVPANQFTAMNWPVEHLGANATIYAGSGVRDHSRAGIQLLSGEVPERTVYTHLGWQNTADGPVYIHCDGAIGASGPVPGVEVRIDDALDRFVLPSPPDGEGLVAAVRASLGIVGFSPEEGIAPDVITFPVYSAIWRAILGDTDFSLHEAGPTGQGKTEIAALAQQHWGPGLDARHLPGSWSSTGNALEGQAFAAKDAVFVVDDFVPGATIHEQARLHREADRVLRAQGNRSGRARMRADGSLRRPKPPRGLILSTGEDIPRGQSLRSRLLVLEVGKGVVNWTQLSLCQRDAAAGLYAQVLAAFVRWLASRYDDVRRGLRAEIDALRDKALRSGQHRRTPEIVANLALGLRLFLDFAEETGAITVTERVALWHRGWAALGEAAETQAKFQQASEPTHQFLTFLTAALGSGEAHIAGPDGAAPTTPEAWGWRSNTRTAFADDLEWWPKGTRIGWLDGTNLYLEPEASYAAAQEMARKGGDSIGVTSQTLRKRLKEHGLLASVDAKRETLTVRRTLEGKQRDVLHLISSQLAPPAPDEPDNSAIDSSGPPW